MAELDLVDAIITDPPYSERTHKGHDAGACGGRDKAKRAALGYQALSEVAAKDLAARFAGMCSGWTVWMTDHTLAPTIMQALEKQGRYVFAPLPFYQPGRSVRLSGDGPCSWTDWIVVSRTAAQMRWGTLRGGYIAGEGWNDKQRMGGKPLPLMLQIVEDYTRHGQTVLDPFLGGGTTALACYKLGRKCIGIEIDPEAFERACRRVDEAARQPDMFVKQPDPKAEQLSMLDPSPAPR